MCSVTRSVSAVYPQCVRSVIVAHYGPCAVRVLRDTKVRAVCAVSFTLLISVCAVCTQCVHSVYAVCTQCARSVRSVCVVCAQGTQCACSVCAVNPILCAGFVVCAVFFSHCATLRTHLPECHPSCKYAPNQDRCS